LSESFTALPPPLDAYLALSFPDAPSQRPHVYLNMVASADGKAAVAGTESALSSDNDKLTLQTLRVHADAILNGAATARMTGVSPLIRDARLRGERGRLGRRRPPLQALLSSSGELPLAAPFWGRKDFDLVVFVSEAASSERIAALRTTERAIEVVPDGAEGLSELMRILRQRYGVGRLLVEGGPTLNSTLFHANLIDEFFLTVSPHIVAGRETITSVEGLPFSSAGLPSLELVSALPNPNTSEVYLHWRVIRGHDTV